MPETMDMQKPALHFEFQDCFRIPKKRVKAKYFHFTKESESQNLTTKHISFTFHFSNSFKPTFAGASCLVVVIMSSGIYETTTCKGFASKVQNMLVLERSKYEFHISWRGVFKQLCSLKPALKLRTLY